MFPDYLVHRVQCQGALEVVHSLDVGFAVGAPDAGFEKNFFFIGELTDQPVQQPVDARGVADFLEKCNLCHLRLEGFGIGINACLETMAGQLDISQVRLLPAPAKEKKRKRIVIRYFLGEKISQSAVNERSNTRADAVARFIEVDEFFPML